MRDLVERYVGRTLSRRAFVRGLTQWGFSAAAVASIVESLAPLVEAHAAEDAPPPAEPASGTVGDTLVEGTGAALLVAQLHAAGVRLIFNCNASGTYPIFDALLDRPDMHVIAVPQEGQMVAIAQGHSLATGAPAFTVNGSVGFPNTLNNLYNAWKDRSPLVVAAQREPRDTSGGRDAFEEWDDYLAPSAAFTRWRWSVDDAARIPEITRRALRIASTPPEGPVTLAFPEDVLAARGVRATILPRERFLKKPEVRPSPALVSEAAQLLVAARSPLLLVGSEVTRSDARAAVLALAEQLALPVAQTDALFDDFPTTSPLFAGTYRPGMPFPPQVDLVLCVGAPIPGREDPLPAGAKLVHASIAPDAIGRVVPADVGIVGDVKYTAADLAAAVGAIATQARLDAIRAPRLAAARAEAERLRTQRASATRQRWDATPISLERVGGELDRVLDRDAIVVPELAEYSWAGPPENAVLARIPFAPDGRSRIGRTTGSALGWGVGAAIGVKLARPDRQVVALQGDGGFLFGQSETLWTMARYEVPVLVVVLNNRSYNGPRNRILREAASRQAQTGRDMTCYLGSPDVRFAELARAFGVAAESVTEPGDLGAALERAVASTREGRPFLVEVVVARTGLGADSTFFPAYSVAAQRTRKV
jgi:acetolactate synthase I/II/III large subunit